MKPKTHGRECIFKPLFFSKHRVPAAKSLKLNHLCQIRGLAISAEAVRGPRGAQRAAWAEGLPHYELTPGAQLVAFP